MTKPLSLDEQGAPRAPWPAALAFAAIGGTLASSCMMPFVALAVVTAATMTRARAVATIAGAFIANQFLGFFILGYPWTFYSLSWGLAQGAAALLALGVARSSLRPVPAAAVPRLLLAFLPSFAAYELSLFGFALIAGGTETFTPAIIGLIAVNEGAWLIGLLIVRLIAVRAAPAWFGRALMLPAIA